MTVKKLTGSTYWRLALLFFALAGTAAVLAQESQTHEAIRQAAEDFALARVQDARLSQIRVESAALDSRLRLAACDRPLETFSNATSSQIARITVGVRCQSEKPWTLYVPVTVDALAEAVFTTRPVLRGEALTADAVEIRRIPLARLPLNPVRDPTQLANMEAIRPLGAGVAVTLNAVKSRQLVQQGQEVMILATGGGIQVRMSGIALRGGSNGDRIPVRNLSSGRTVEAEVLDRGTVRVNL